MYYLYFADGFGHNERTAFSFMTKEKAQEHAKKLNRALDNSPYCDCGHYYVRKYSPRKAKHIDPFNETIDNFYANRKGVKS